MLPNHFPTGIAHGDSPFGFAATGERGEELLWKKPHGSGPCWVGASAVGNFVIERGHGRNPLPANAKWGMSIDVDYPQHDPHNHPSGIG